MDEQIDNTAVICLDHSTYVQSVTLRNLYIDACHTFALLEHPQTELFILFKSFVVSLVATGVPRS